MIRKQKPSIGEFYLPQEELIRMVISMRTFMSSIKDFIAKIPRPKSDANQNAKPNVPAGQTASEETPKQAGATSKKPADIKGQGAPVYAAPTQSSINLKLPEKKRKAGPGASPSPAPEAVIPSDTKPETKAATAMKASSVQMQNQPPAPPALPSKCPVPTCPHHVSGFATDVEAEKHAAKEHKYTGNPLNWMLEMMKSALGVAGDIPKLENLYSSDKLNNFASKTTDKPKINLSAPPPKSTSKPVPAVSTKTASTSQGLKTSQSNIKAGSPNGLNITVKRTAGALEDGQAEGSPAKKHAAIFEDSWTASLVTREAIHDAFGGVHELMAGTNITSTSETQIPPPMPTITDASLPLEPIKDSTANLKAEQALQPMLSGLPSPPPVTWDDTPESVENISPKENGADSKTTNAFDKKGTMMDWTSMNMLAPGLDQNFDFNLANPGFMDWQDSGVGLDSYDFDPSEMVQQMFEQSIQPQIDLDALIAQQGYPA